MNTSMRRALLVLAAVLPAGPAPADDGAGLVNRRQVFAPNEPYEHRGRTWGLGCMRLSPDGKRVLCIRRQVLPASNGQPGLEVSRLVLRELAEGPASAPTAGGGKDTVIPIPASAWEEILIRLTGRNCFSPDGSKLVLARGADVDLDGIFQVGKARMQAVIYTPAAVGRGSLEAGRLEPIAQAQEMVLPQFDRTGRGLIIVTLEKTSGKLFLLDLPEMKLRQLSLWGMPMLPCPSDDLLPVFYRDRDEGRLRFVLYDLAADKQVADLPVHPSNTLLEDFLAQWTADGRFLYYCDLQDPPDGQGPSRMVTRVYDRQAGKVARVIDGAYPAGAGPAGTMVIGQCRREKARSADTVPASRDLLRPETSPPAMVLHEPASGASWLLAESPVRIFHAGGGKVLYSTPVEKGKYATFLADIQAPMVASRPATTKMGRGGAEDTEKEKAAANTGGETAAGKPAASVPTSRPALPASRPASRPSFLDRLEREFGIEKVFP